MNRLRRIFFSPITPCLLLCILAVSSAIGTFVENDLGTVTARRWVYDSLWYEFIIALSLIHMVIVMTVEKKYRFLAVFAFHMAFVLIFVGAGITRYYGVEGTMHIREGESNRVFQRKDFSSDADGIDTSLPFTLHLNDFQMTTYPGSNSPSSFASEVEVRDAEDVAFTYLIGMNEKLSHRGYNFYQTSYDADFKGTILTVGWDPGVHITFAGYLLFFIALVASLFDPRSRIHKLRARISQHGHALVLGFMICLGGTSPVYAAPDKTPDALGHPYFERYTNTADAGHAFGKLTVQSRMGRMKPMDTLSREITTKLSGRHTLYGFSANQLVLGMATQARLWQRIPMIKVKHPEIRRMVGLADGKKLASFNQFFNGSTYLLKERAAAASAKEPIQRNTLDRALIRVDEKVHVANMVYNSNLLKLFPLPNNANQRWVNPKEIWGTFDPTSQSDLRATLKQFFDGGFDADATRLEKAMVGIAAYQQQHGSAVMPSDDHLAVELRFNQARIFSRLALAYTLSALLVFGITLLHILRNKTYPRWLPPAVLALVALLFITHSVGIIVRWYLAGDAPLTNTYESIVYIAWSSVLAALILFRRSLLGMSASLMMAGTFMFAAHLNNLDPEITNLVPVLKSFWLVVHVSVITASYGFFGVGCILGLTALLIVSLQPSQYKRSLPAIAAINELALLSGLVLLILGNFLGSVWANESWGRYWGWDPKETWAYISIIAYAVVLHMRMIKGCDNPLLLSIGSILAFASILMTYFGVNFYLTGLHSYATGDPVPIPTSVWISIITIGALITTASLRVKAFTK